ncbi:MAG: preprotein translocase subunit YajC [Gaiellaceae bacterium]
MEPGGLIVLVALFALFWLFVIKPQRRRLQDQRTLHESVTVGDEIVTMGGLLGHVRGVNDEDDTLVVEIAPGTNVRVARRGIAAVLPPEDGSGAEPHGDVPS